MRIGSRLLAVLPLYEVDLQLGAEGSRRYLCEQQEAFSLRGESLCSRLRPRRGAMGFAFSFTIAIWVVLCIVAGPDSSLRALSKSAESNLTLVASCSGSDCRVVELLVPVDRKFTCEARVVALQQYDDTDGIFGSSVQDFSRAGWVVAAERSRWH